MTSYKYMNLLAIVLPLLVGFAVGYMGKLPGLLRRIEKPLSRLTLLFLIGLMGIKIGSRDGIVNELLQAGLFSLLIAGASIIGSLLFLKAVSPMLETSMEDSKQKKVSSNSNFRVTLYIVVTIITAIVVGYMVVPETFASVLDPIITYTMGLLLFCVGISLGLKKDVLVQVVHLGWKIMLIPASIALGSILGSILIGLLLNSPPLEAAAVGAGFGWYSLSAILLTELHSPELGTVAFLANSLRELLTFLLLPFVVRYFGKILSLAPGGATSMDVTLPAIRESAGESMVLPAFFSGTVLSSLVPLLVPLIVGL